MDAQQLDMPKYDSAMLDEDASIERVIGHLKEIGLYENTLIVITSNRGGAEGTLALRQDTVSIPLLVKYPGQQMPGGRIS